MNHHGVFINYRHEARYFAGRIYDYLQSHGFDPFMDCYSLGQGEYDRDLRDQVRQAPYFLIVLTPGCLDELAPEDEKDTYYREIEAAFDSGREILLVADAGFAFPASLPEKIASLSARKYYTVNEAMDNFYIEMDRLCRRDISLRKLEGILNWREYAAHNANVFLAARSQLESGLASLSNRFGADLVQAVQNREAFTGEYRIKHINMSCYAASIIFAPERNMVDHRAYDYGMMFNIFSALLQDEDFSMNLITNSPDSPAAADAIEAAKLGNSSLEDNQRAVFLSSYASIDKLVLDEPYKSAKKQKRFRYLITDAVLPFAYFQIIYKAPWAEYNHIKLDLYTEGLGSNTMRRSMIIFERDHPDTYAFLQSQFNHLRERSSRASRDLIRANNDKWIAEWEAYLEEIE